MFKSDDEDNLKNLSPSHTNLKISELTKINDIQELYDVGEQLGYGAYGIVYKAIDLRTKEVKSLKIASKRKEFCRHFQEIKILFQIKHPNIIMLEKAFEITKHICLVFEYCPRDLNKILADRKFLREFEVHQISKYLISAVAYLHMNSIVHRDLKIENILLASNPDDSNDEWFIKLIDFGLSAIRLKSDNNHKVMFVEFCGTPNYMAPELSTKSYSQQCDMWSIGIILYLLLSGCYPYTIEGQFRKLDDFENAIKIILNTKVDYESLACSDQAIDLIKRCLNVNPAIRITAGEMLNDPWILGHANSFPNRNTNILLLMDEFNNNVCNQNQQQQRHGQTEHVVSQRDTNTDRETVTANLSPINPNFRPDSMHDLHSELFQISDVKELFVDPDTEQPKITISSSRQSTNSKYNEDSEKHNPEENMNL